MLNGMQNGGNSKAQPFEAEYLSFTSYDTSGASKTLSAEGLGKASPDRRIYVGMITTVSSTAGGASTAITVGGIAASELTSDGNIGAVPGSDIRVKWWVADVPSGTTGDIVITATLWSWARLGVVVARVVGGSGSEVMGYTESLATDTSISHSINIPIGGCAFALLGVRSGSIAVTVDSPFAEEHQAAWDSEVTMCLGSIDRVAGSKTASMSFASTSSRRVLTTFSVGP